MTMILVSETEPAHPETGLIWIKFEPVESAYRYIGGVWIPWISE